MRIIQISDLHIGGLFKQDAFDTMIEEVNNDLKPDLIVLSGDLTDDGLVFQLKKAQDEIKKFDCRQYRLGEAVRMAGKEVGDD